MVVNNKNGVQANPHGATDSSWVPKKIAPFTRVSKKHITITGINPDSLQQPTIGDIAPNGAPIDTTINFTIYGDKFVKGANVLFSNPDILTRDITFKDKSTLNVRIEISASAKPGSSDITVINPGGKQSILSGAFKIYK